mgnify:FL=1
MDSNYNFEVGKYYKYRDNRIYLCSGVNQNYILFSHELLNNTLDQLPYEYSYTSYKSDNIYWKEYFINKISYNNKRLNRIIHAI